MANYKVRIAGKGGISRQDSLFALQRIYGSSYYARPYIAEGSKSEFKEVLDALGLEIDENQVRKIDEQFYKKVKTQLAANRVTGAATYVFKNPNPEPARYVWNAMGLPVRNAPRIVYKPGSYLGRIYYRMGQDNDFTIFIGSGQGDINSFLDGAPNLQGGRSQKFVTYSATIDQGFQNRRPYTVEKTRKVFMPYKDGARWVTLEAGRVINPPQNRPVNTLAIWREVVNELKTGLIKAE